MDSTANSELWIFTTGTNKSPDLLFYNEIQNLWFAPGVN